jgi:hypothetical protein
MTKTTKSIASEPEGFFLAIGRACFQAGRSPDAAIDCETPASNATSLSNSDTANATIGGDNLADLRTMRYPEGIIDVCIDKDPLCASHRPIFRSPVGRPRFIGNARFNRRPIVNPIQPYRLWVGHAGDGRDFGEIFRRGIKAVVQLAIEEPPLQPPRELVYLRLPLLDGSGNDPALLRLAVDCVTSLLQRGTPTLVCCGGGMSRSPAIVAAALSAIEKTDAEPCLERVIQSHPADVSPGLWDEIRRASEVFSEKGRCL